MKKDNKVLGRPIEVLLLENNYNDILYLRNVFEKGDTSNKLNILNDGEEALKYLYKKDKYNNVPTPDIILLSLNLPKISGLNMLKIIKSDKNLKSIPIIMLDELEINNGIKNSNKTYLN